MLLGKEGTSESALKLMKAALRRRGARLLIAALLLLLFLWVVLNVVNIVWLNVSDHIALLQASVGKRARMVDAGGNEYDGILGCAEVVPADGRFRFKVTILTGWGEKRPLGGISLTEDPWAFGCVQVMEEAEEAKR